ncbi:MAG: hypothetical protein IIB22_06820 [Chloroflexi bacterium]|nr:hypothetical protein [Chloroflexota bacterium]
MDYARRDAFGVSVTALLDGPPEVKYVPVDRDALTALAKEVFGLAVAEAVQASLMAATVNLDLVLPALQGVRKQGRSVGAKLVHHRRKRPTWNSALRAVYRKHFGKYPDTVPDPDQIDGWTKAMTFEACLQHEGTCVEWWWRREALDAHAAQVRELIRVLEYGLIRAATREGPLDGCVPERVLVMPRPDRFGIDVTLKGHFLVLRRDLEEWKAILRPLGARLVEWSELALFLNKDKEEGTTAKRRETRVEFLLRVREAIDMCADSNFRSTREFISKLLGFNTVSAFTKRFQRLPGERITFAKVREAVLGERTGGHYGQMNR